MTSSESNRTLVRRIYEEALNGGRLDVLDELVAADFVLHSAMLGEIRGRDAYRRGIEALLRGAPDLRATVDALLAAEGDHVVARISYTGTDVGGFMTGQPGTGKPFEFTGIYIWRVDPTTNQLTELWQEADRARILQQLTA